MEREALVRVARRMLRYAERGATATHPKGPRRNPASTYTDPEQFRREREIIFGRAPQLVCFGSDLAEPGTYRTFGALGVPIGVLRDSRGRLRAFLNAGAHPRARLLEGNGRLDRRIVCPYHGWADALDGTLAAIHREETFGSVDRSCYGLTPLPCEERYGLIYVAPRPDAPFTIDGHLGELGPELGSWDLAEARAVGSHEGRLRTNWKLALDTFCEGYHFLPRHPKTIATFAMTNCTTYDTNGPELEHHRLGFPNKSLLDLGSRPETEWGDPFDHLSFVYYLFPNVSLLVARDVVEFFRLHPDEQVDEHVTQYTLYSRLPLDRDGARKRAERHFEFIQHVVDTEDHRVSAGVQRNLRAGLLAYTTFGRNEPSLIHMHRPFRRKAGLPLADEGVPEGDPS